MGSCNIYDQKEEVAMFGLVDCNNFYVSCERVFRPDLLGRPTLVLSNNDKKGCVIARSEEVKKLGIEMGVPFYQVERLVKEHDIAVFSSNFVLYGDMSSRVMATLREFVDEMEVYSIDEAFLDLSTYSKLNLRTYGKRMVDTVKQNTGIPVSMGMAATKTLAKVASKFAKKYKKYGGVCIISTEEQRIKALQLFDIGDVWGVGHQYKKLLNDNGVNTAYDFTLKPESWVRRRMTVNGVRTWKELQGVSCAGLEEGKAKQAICTSRSFSILVSDYSILSEAVSNFATSCARKLREQHTASGSVHVFIHTSPFREDTLQFNASRTAILDMATNSSSELVRAALGLLKEMYVPGRELKKAGVIVSRIVPENAIQGSLFNKIDHNRLRKADETMDKINHKFGRGTLKIAAQGNNEKWELSNSYLSRRYTTNWNELLEVR